MAVTQPGRIQTVVLCGGKGTRPREYIEAIPNALVEVGARPILWHIMKSYPLPRLLRGRGGGRRDVFRCWQSRVGISRSDGRGDRVRTDIAAARVRMFSEARRLAATRAWDEVPNGQRS